VDVDVVVVGDMGGDGDVNVLDHVVSIVDHVAVAVAVNAHGNVDVDDHHAGLVA
jgi:imidazoleglycerol phosphate dehydratase HisB